MATLCKNCGAPVVFDPRTQKVLCRTCGSAWNAEDIESSDKALLEKNKAVSVNEINGSVKQEFFDCYVYTCSSCGGEIAINGSEASTKCVYCGSTSVVFNRIAKEKAPEFILPFQISKEEAVAKVKETFNKGKYIPDEVKNLNPTDVRGIYVPYWIVSGYHTEANIVMRKKGKNSASYYGRAGTMGVRHLPIDASRMLSDESSQRLEPFDLTHIKYFDEDYLLGFYSNISDITNVDLYDTVHKRASEAFQDKVKDTVPGETKSSKSIVLKSSATLIDRNVYYTMLPVWFVSYEFEGKHNTMLVNGDTGKVVGGIPWDKKRFRAKLFAIAGSLTVAFSAFFYAVLFPAIKSTVNKNGKHSDPSAILFFVLFLDFLGWLVLKFRMNKVKDQIKRSQSSSIFNFMKKRQG